MKQEISPIIPTTRVAVMGEKRSGHSVICSRFLYGNDSPRTSIDEETFTKCLEVNGEDENVNLNVYFQEMGFVHQYCQNSDAFLLVFSPTSYSSFEQVQKYYECIQENKSMTQTPVALVCCTSKTTIRRKLEEIEKEEDVREEDIETFSKLTGCPVYYIDANSLNQVYNLFSDVVEMKRLKNPIMKEKKRSIVRRTFHFIRKTVSLS